MYSSSKMLGVGMGASRVWHWSQVENACQDAKQQRGIGF